MSETVDLSKTKIRDLVLRAGVPLRSMRNEKGQLIVGTRCKRNVYVRFGYWFLNGEVQQHPKEYPVVIEIIERWKSGLGDEFYCDLVESARGEVADE